MCALLAFAPVAGSAAQQDDPGKENAPAVKRIGDEAADEYVLDLAVPASTVEVDSEGLAELPDPERSAQLRDLLARLAARPGDAGTLRELDRLLSSVMDEADSLMDQERVDEAARLLAVVRSVNPRQRGLAEAARRLQTLQALHVQLDAALAAQAAGRWVEPAGDNAWDLFERAAGIAPEHPAVKLGLRDVQQVLVGYAIDAAKNLDFENAEAWLYEASRVREPQDLVDEARAEIEEYRERKAAAIEQDVLDAMNRGDFDLAEFTLIDLIALGDYEERVNALRQRVARERVYGTYRPGQVIQDLFLDQQGVAPAVVVIAAGSFTMGSPDSARGAEENESPAHRVRIERGFALGMQEVTVAQFRTFVESTGYQTLAESEGHSRVWDDAMGRLAERQNIHWKHDFEGQQAILSLPVLHVGWRDAQAYVRWLSEATGERYRLPTEAEFEYALRAGTSTDYWWGNSRPSEPLENLTGERDSSDSGRKWSAYFRGYGDDFWGPAPGGSLQANPWGLYDMAGNVSEWVQDCWHATYARAPQDGTAWENPGCPSRVVRGGNWASAPGQARSAARLFAREDLRGPIVGFRIARDL